MRLAATQALLAVVAVGCTVIAGLDGEYRVADPGSGAASVGGAAAIGSSSSSGSGANGGGGAGSGGSSSSSTGVGGAVPVATSCKQILDAGNSLGDGEYLVDIDGGGTLAPITVRCDMTIDGGGWTRFHWLTGAQHAAGSDPLFQQLQDCDVGDGRCYGRIPALASPAALLVKDVTDGEHAAWTFDGSPVANAVLGALQNKVQFCIDGQNNWQPYLDTSSESYCGNEGDCDAFNYTDGSCGGFADWTLMLDDDNFWCQTAFKLGATFGDSTFGNGCGSDDHGYLNDCDCDDEGGELYYR
jgi:hypothetical protein